MSNSRQRIRLFLVLIAFLALSQDGVRPHILATVSQLETSPLRSAPDLTEKAKPTSETLHLDSAPQEDGESKAAEQTLRNLFREAHFSEAILIAQNQLRSETLSVIYKEWLREQLPTLKLGLAWQFIRQGRCEDAQSYLEPAQKGNSSALALKGLGYCALKRRDSYAALDYLQHYVEKNPMDPESYILLAEAKESLGLMDEALQLTQKAQSLETLTDEERDELQHREQKITAKLDEVPAQGEISAGYFLLRFQIQENQNLVQGSLEILQNHVQNLVQNLGFEYPTNPIEVIFHRQDNFNRSTHGPEWSSGIYDGRMRIPVQPQQILDENLARVLRHELTHAMLSEQARHQFLPRWFQEGLAQFAECPQFCLSYRFAATSQRFLNPEAFEQSFQQLSDMEAQLAYRQSLYLILTLNRQYQGLSGLKQIIQQLPQLNVMSSDQILSQVGSDYRSLYTLASEGWTQQKSF